MVLTFLNSRIRTCCRTPESPQAPFWKPLELNQGPEEAICLLQSSQRLASAWLKTLLLRIVGENIMSSDTFSRSFQSKKMFRGRAIYRQQIAGKTHQKSMRWEKVRTDRWDKIPGRVWRAGAPPHQFPEKWHLNLYQAWSSSSTCFIRGENSLWGMRGGSDADSTEEDRRLDNANSENEWCVWKTRAADVSPPGRQHLPAHQWN